MSVHPLEAPDPPNLRRLVTLAVLVLVALLALRPLPSLLVDLLWFGEVGFRGVMLTTLWTQALMQLVFGGAFVVFFLANVIPALARRPPQVSVLHELRAMWPGLDQLRPVLRLAAIAVALGIGFLVAQWGAAQWLPWLRFRHPAPFGFTDPVFQRDVGYYVFTLPFLRALVGFGRFTALFTAAGVAFAYFTQGHLWARPGFLAVAGGARRHLMLLAAAVLLLTGASDWLARYDLLYSTRGIVAGAGFTDLHAALPALQIIAVLAGLAALLVAAETFTRSWRLSLGSIAVLLLAHLLLLGLWPFALQRFVVAPNEIDRERPYLEREIVATRRAFGLEAIDVGGFPATTNLTAARISANTATIDNVRLWETRPLKTTNSQLQEIRTYYDFVDVDNDRYRLNGDLRQVALSARELNPAALPARIWINEHLTYTHGYGVCVAPVNRISPEGLPDYFVKDIPPVSSVPELKITRPEIYYGELGARYVFVRSRAREFDYPSGQENVYATYDGRGGIRLGGVAGRALFALHLAEPKILLSGDLGGESRILLHRTVRERVVKIAPFIAWERDPYIVIRRDGTLAWMLDGYTTTDRVPYSAPVPRLGNYIRNPVKATVDAYHGTVTLWVVDPSDPLMASYSSIFPGAFAALDSMPDDLKAHMRYPEGLFSVQANVYATYHMTDPQVFYNKEDLWKPARRDANAGQDGGDVAPYFTIMRLAGVGEREEFILMLPFTPARKENMIAWMCARCDPPYYGKLLVYTFPKQRLVYGPQQIESRINQDTEISKELTLWNQQGSAVIRGNLLVVPVDSSVVYFQPLYLQAAGEAGLPELKRILIAYADRIAMETTMAGALDRVFGSGAGDRIESASSPRGARLEPPQAGGAPRPAGAASTEERLRRATEIYRRAQEALRRGDLEAFAREIDALGRTLEGAPRR